MSWTKTQAHALGAAFAALDAAGIDWLVLRNHEGLPETNRSKDVDLGLKKADFRRAERAISAGVREAGFDRVLVEDFQYAHCLTFFSTAGPVPQSIKIDLLDGFAFRGAQVFDFSQLYADGRRDNGFVIPSASDDAVMLWAKPLLNGGIVKPKYLPDIERAAREDAAGFRAVLDRIFTADWAGRVWSKIEAGDVHGTIAMKTGLRHSVWMSAFRKQLFGTISNTLRHIHAETARRLRRKSGTFFSILGPDGVGKTTFIELFSEGLQDLKVKDADRILVEHFRPRILPNINCLLTGKTETVEENFDPHRAPPASTPSSLLRLAYYWFDYVLGYWGKHRRLCIRGRNVIFDRYFYDFIVDPRRSRLSLPGWVPKAFLRVTPQPDIVFVLNADAEDIFARKQELSLDEISRQLDRYRALAATDTDRFVLLDASQPPEKVARDALEAVVTRCYRMAER